MNENSEKAEGKSLPNRRKESTYCRRAYGTFLVAGYSLSFFGMGHDFWQSRRLENTRTVRSGLKLGVDLEVAFPLLPGSGSRSLAIENAQMDE
jgi:hypothetical protein